MGGSQPIREAHHRRKGARFIDQNEADIPDIIIAFSAAQFVPKLAELANS